MAFFSRFFRDQAESPSPQIALAGLNAEFEDHVNRVSAWAGVSHNADGTHNVVGEGHDFIPIGGMVKWPSTVTVPSRWLKADGSSVSRTQYSALFAVYGTRIGAGDGSTTFTLPTETGFIVLAGA